MSVIMLLYLWGSCIAYLVIIGDSFHPLIELAVGKARLLVSGINSPCDFGFESCLYLALWCAPYLVS